MTYHVKKSENEHTRQEQQLKKNTQTFFVSMSRFTLEKK